MKRGQASSTAKVIAASTLLLAGDASTASLVPTDAAALCRAFMSDGLKDRCLRTAAVQPWLRPAWRALEACTHPGIMTHYWHRKRWIETRCRAAVAHDVRRVVVLGAGFDTLALRLAAKYPHVQWLELDHPDTQAAKQRGIARHRLQLPPNLRMHPWDMAREGLPAELTDDPRATLVILEGLLMYLHEPVVQRLLTIELPTLSQQTLRVIFSYMVRWPDGRAGFRPSSRLVDAWLRWRGEPFKWMGDPQALQQWLIEHRFEVLAHRRPPFGDGHEFDRADLDDAGLQGENLVDVMAPMRT